MSAAIDSMLWLEPAWNAGDNLIQIVPVLMIGDRRRSMRLFALACAELIRDRITDPRSIAAFEFAAKYIEVGVYGRRGRPAIEAAAEAAVEEAVARHDYRNPTPETPQCAREIIVRQIAAALVNPDELHQATQVSNLVANLRFHDRPWDYLQQPGWSQEATWQAQREENRALVDLLRDVAGNPFHPVTFDPSWRTSTAVALARGIYAERAFDRLPILADALQDAGCDNADILDHCRDPKGTHVRGCWAVDLVTGKT
jgi:hypothetical protein